MGNAQKKRLENAAVLVNIFLLAMFNIPRKLPFLSLVFVYFM